MSSNDEELRFSYLLSGNFDILPDSYIKLRSYLNIYVSDLAAQQNLKLLKSFRNRNKTCPYCYSSWSADTTTFNLLPSKRWPRAQSKNSEKQKDETSEISQLRNTLVIRCRVCTKKSSFSLVKKKHVGKRLKEENVEVVKKKKKKKDKSCGLTVNLQKPQNHLQQIFFAEKKKRLLEGTIAPKPANSQNNESETNRKNIPIQKTKPKSFTGKKKQLVLNPYANQVQVALLKKKNKKLQRLKQAVKEEKSNFVKKTLKDFLTLV